MYTEIKTFEDACKVLNLDATKVIPDFSLFPIEEQEAMKAHAKLSSLQKQLMAIGFQTGQMGIGINITLGSKWVLLRVAVFRPTSTLSGVRVRVSARAFASKLEKKQYMQVKLSKTCIKHTL